MFKDRAVQVRFVKEPALTRAQAVHKQEAVWTPEIVSALIQDQIQNIIFSVGVVYVAKVAVDTLSDVILRKVRDKNTGYNRPN